MDMDSNTRTEIVDFLEHRVADCKILVIGDVMLDRYFYGKVTRISPEAPVPVNLIEQQRDTLGGAANVAHNLVELGCQAWLTGVIGDDHHGRLLLQKMDKFGINSDGIIKGRKKTTSKIRVLGEHQQMIRLDFEETEPIVQDEEQQILDFLTRCAEKGLQSIIISDYGKGVCTESLCQKVIACANQHHIHVLVDPKGVKWRKYSKAEYITPNVKETAAVIGAELKNTDEALRQAAIEIKKQYDIANVMITRSEKGISLYHQEEEIDIPTVAQEVFDVSGAGDTVIAVFAAGIADNMSAKQAAQMANFAAGIEVGKLGTYAVSKEDILSALSKN